jgi:hypothetical protein
MTEHGRPLRAGESSRLRATEPERDADDSERSLGRAVAVTLPLAGIGSAVAVGFYASFGTALLVLAASALIGTIAFLWASVRTLSGDAPLPVGFESLARQRHAGVDSLGERKRQVLRSLKDLEGEHALGRIDDTDYSSFVTRYRAEAKAVMREMDLEGGPARAEAERVAREYLEKRGLGTEPPPGPVSSDRRECRTCHASNESDATFCKACGASISSSPEKTDAKR